MLVDKYKYCLENIYNLHIKNLGELIHLFSF